MIKRVRRLPRRTFLRGLGGIAVAVPTLEIMLDDHGEALAQGDPLPRRFFVGFNGQSMGGDGDPVHNMYAPSAFGPGYDLQPATMPLGDYDDVREHVSIVSNLRIPYGDTPPAGGWGLEFHVQALCPLICGVRTMVGSNYAQGPTADQIVAAAVGSATVFPSLQYQVQASWYLTDSAPYGRDLLSYKLDAQGDLVRMPGQISPQLAWQSLFTGFVPPDASEAEAALRELRKRRSILDLVAGDAERLIGRLGTVDRQRMQRHLDELRALELRLEQMPPPATGQCMMLEDPGADPPVGASNVGTGGDMDFDTGAGYSDEYVRARIFTDLVHMAFTCDLTRSVSLLYTMAQSHMNVHAFTGIPYDQHEVGHSVGETQAVSQIIAWHMDHFAYLVSKLRDTPEGAGSLLDNCALVLLHEGGHGLDPGTNEDNSSHSTENMIVTVAGHAGGLVGGLHVDGAGRHPVNVLNTAMRAVGVDEDLGEVVGPIDELLP